MEQVQFVIHSDGRVEEKVTGVKGGKKPERKEKKGRGSGGMNDGGSGKVGERAVRRFLSDATRCVRGSATKSRRRLRSFLVGSPYLLRLSYAPSGTSKTLSTRIPVLRHGCCLVLAWGATSYGLSGTETGYARTRQGD
eukprot:2635212-Rhodomonas_salina.2